MPSGIAASRQNDAPAPEPANHEDPESEVYELEKEKQRKRQRDACHEKESGGRQYALCFIRGNDGLQDRISRPERRTGSDDLSEFIKAFLLMQAGEKTL
jgi:hypothetical protein